MVQWSNVFACKRIRFLTNNRKKNVSHLLTNQYCHALRSCPWNRSLLDHCVCPIRERCIRCQTSWHLQLGVLLIFHYLECPDFHSVSVCSVGKRPENILSETSDLLARECLIGSRDTHFGDYYKSIIKNCINMHLQLVLIILIILAIKILLVEIS